MSFSKYILQYRIILGSDCFALGFFRDSVDSGSGRFGFRLIRVSVDSGFS